jgi:hypothetical protein
MKPPDSMTTQGTLSLGFSFSRELGVIAGAAAYDPSGIAP